MDKKTEALKLAEDALKRVRTQDMELVQLSMIALAAIREALAEQPAQQEQEPVAWISGVRCVGPEYGKKRYGALPVQSLQPGYYAHTPLYTSPPAQPSKPLTDEQHSLAYWQHEINKARDEAYLQGFAAGKKEVKCSAG